MMASTVLGNGTSVPQLDQFILSLQAAGKSLSPLEVLREMDRNGFQAGGHTVHHTILSRISPGLLLREVAECKEELEGYLDRRIETFAYPNGDPNDFTDEVVETVRRTGYRAAYTTVFGANGARQHPHQLRRVTVYGADQAEIALQIERFFYMV